LQSVSSLAEASAFLAAATAERRRVRIGADLATDGLDRVLEHEAGDLTATVEAGIRLSSLNARLAEAGQRLSLDPPGDPTIGACIAADLSGPRRHRYGTMRDLVLGVTVVLADGTIANAGGKVVKNVAGYDLGKLLCGSRGTLALIVRVSLRLHPIPASARLIYASNPNLNRFERLEAGHCRPCLPTVKSIVMIPMPEARLPGSSPRAPGRPGRSLRARQRTPPTRSRLSTRRAAAAAE